MGTCRAFSSSMACRAILSTFREFWRPLAADCFCWDYLRGSQPCCWRSRCALRSGRCTACMEFTPCTTTNSRWHWQQLVLYWLRLARERFRSIIRSSKVGHEEADTEAVGSRGPVVAAETRRLRVLRVSG